jgi:hypothetical protein
MSRVASLQSSGSVSVRLLRCLSGSRGDLVRVERLVREPEVCEDARRNRCRLRIGANIGPRAIGNLEGVGVILLRGRSVVRMKR